VAHVDLEPRRRRHGQRSFRWLLLGQMPAEGDARTLRPTLADGSFDMDDDGACRIDRGVAPIETLEALASAWRRAL
jgi:hypothetical protein